MHRRRTRRARPAHMLGKFTGGGGGRSHLYGWFHEGDATPLLEHAIQVCVRDHGGRVSAAPTLKVVDMKIGSGRTRPVSILVIEDDKDGWWDEYLRVHGWVDSVDEITRRLADR